MGNKVFEFTLRVPYADVDPMGFVYYARYYVYFEMARCELLREAGMPYAELEKNGVMLPVLESHCEHKRPAHFEDELVVRSRCTDLRGPRLRIEYEVRRAADLIATGYTEHACMGPDYRPCRPSAEIQRLAGL